MTLELIISFGGVLLVGAILFSIAMVLIRKERQLGVEAPRQDNDLAVALDRAHRAIKRAEVEIADAKQRVAS